MPQAAARRAADTRPSRPLIPISARMRGCSKPSLTLLLLGVLASLGPTAIQCGSVAFRPEMEKQLEYPRLTAPSTDLNIPESHEDKRVVACRRTCWVKYVSGADQNCLGNAMCHQCYLDCATPPPTTLHTTYSSSLLLEKEQHSQQAQHSQQLPKINKSIQETWSLHTVSMLQQDSLVLVDIAWEPLNTPNQCLISWEVSGGGLMGNLLTESSNVQLSLWPDTKYRVKVTCKNKITGFMSRSLPLTIDTSEAIKARNQAAQHRPILANPDAMSSSTTVSNKIYTPFVQQHEINSNSIDRVSNYVINDDNDAATPSLSHGYSEIDNAAVLPYDERDDEQDQSAEALNQHTSFIFNWHAKNNDISAIEQLEKPDLNILNIAALSDMQQPLIFGLIAGTILLTLVLLMYVCLVRQQRMAQDKAALITDAEVHAVVVSMPPAVVVAAAAAVRANNKTAARKAMESACDSGGGAPGATSLAFQHGEDKKFEGLEEVCRNPDICSRNALKV